MPYAEFQMIRTKAATLDVSQKIELITFLVQSLNQATNKESHVIKDSVLSLQGVFKDFESDENLKTLHMSEKYGL